MTRLFVSSFFQVWFCIITQNTAGPSESEDIKDNVLISQTEQQSPVKAPKSQSPYSDSAGEGFNQFYIKNFAEILA